MGWTKCSTEICNNRFECERWNLKINSSKQSWADFYDEECQECILKNEENDD